MITVLKSKIRIAVVTEASKDYKGSITIDEELMEAANMREWEKVEVNARDKDVRIKTYILKGKRGSRCIKANGGLAQYLQEGDIIHILAYKTINEDEDHTPILVDYYTDDEIFMGS